jgi:IS6 family transposase
VGATLYTVVDRCSPTVPARSRSRWFVDETYVKVAGVWRYVYRAVDEHGQVIDALVSKRRDIAAARAFFAAAVLAHGEPEEVITDRTAAPANVVAELFLAHGTTPSSTRTTESSATTDV